MCELCWFFISFYTGISREWWVIFKEVDLKNNETKFYKNKLVAAGIIEDHTG